MKTTEKESKPHKLCLTWEGGRETVELTESTTMKELGETARKLLDCACCLTISYPKQQQLVLDDTLARSVVPHMTRVHCIVAKKRELEEMTEEKETRMASRNKKRAASDVVDLTEEDDPTKDDEALAHRLQQQEEENEVAADAGAAIMPRSHVPSVARTTPPRMGDERDPTTVTTPGIYWIYQNGPDLYRSESVLGKWLVFSSAEKINELWQTIRKQVASGHLCSPQAKVATKFNSVQHQGNSKSSYVICVYTSKARMDKVALKLIQTVQHNICYKTDEATRQGQYAYNNSSSEQCIAIRTCYWNRARPTFTKPSKRLTCSKSLSMARNAAKQKPALTRRFDDRVVTCVGMARHNNNNNNNSSKQQFEIGVTRVVLHREPSNSYDANAIRVDDCMSNKKIGYIQRDDAALLAPWLDHELVVIDSAVMHHRVEDSTMYFRITGTACDDAKDLLAAL